MDLMALKQAYCVSPSACVCVQEKSFKLCICYEYVNSDIGYESSMDYILLAKSSAATEGPKIHHKILDKYWIIYDV